MFKATYQRSRTVLIPGHWRVVQRSGDKPGDPVSIIKLACPLCGAEGDLSDHKIDADGAANPSVVCPADGCEWHEHVTLDQWGETDA